MSCPSSSSSGSLASSVKTPTSPMQISPTPPLHLYNLSTVASNTRVRDLLVLYFRANHAVDLPDNLSPLHQASLSNIIDQCFSNISELEHHRAYLVSEIPTHEPETKWILECCARLVEQKSGTFEEQELDNSDLKPLATWPDSVQRVSYENLKRKMVELMEEIKSSLSSEEVEAVQVTFAAVFAELDHIEKEVRAISDKHRLGVARREAAEAKKQTLWWEHEELADDFAAENEIENISDLRIRTFYHLGEDFRPDGKTYWVYDLYDLSRGL